MKILFWGNQDCYAYRLAKWLRASGHDVSLCMMARDNVRSDPQVVDPDFDMAENDWIFSYDNSRPFQAIFLDSVVRRRVESEFDIILVFGFYAMLNVWRINKPFIVMSLGPTNLGVVKTEVDAGKDISLRWELARYFVRKSVRRSRRIMVHYDPEINSLKKIGQLDKARLWGLAESVADIKGMVDQEFLSGLKEKYSGYNKVLLWLSRSIYRNTNSAEYKGTDKFVLGVAQVIHERKSNVKVVIGDHGFDIDGIKSLVVSLGIEDYVEYVPHLPMRHLAAYLSIPNAIIFDELTDKMSTSCGMLREGLSVGGVVVKSFSKEMIQAAYSVAPPVCYAYSDNDVRNVLEKLLDMSPDEFDRMRGDSMRWAKNYLDINKCEDLLMRDIAEVFYLNK